MCTKLKSVLKGITATLFILFVELFTVDVIRWQGTGTCHPSGTKDQWGQISGDGPPDHLAAKVQTYSLISKYLLQKNDQETP
jgi:hypothetical protein